MSSSFPLRVSTTRDERPRYAQAVDDALTTRPGRRQQALKAIAACLATRPGLLADRTVTLLTLCLSSAGAAAPSAEANLAISLVVPVLLARTDRWPTSELEGAVAALQRLAVSSRHGFVRETAAMALGAVALLSEHASLQQDALEWLLLIMSERAGAEFLEDDKNKLQISLAHGALQAWVLLATSWEWNLLAHWTRRPTRALLRVCRSILAAKRSGGPGLRITAALGLALAVEARVRAGEAAAAETELNEAAEVAEELAQLDEWKEQRRLFRSFERLKHGQLPDETICEPRCKRLRLYSFVSLIRYAWLSLRGSLDLSDVGSYAYYFLLCQDRRAGSLLCDIEPREENENDQNSSEEAAAAV